MSYREYVNENGDGLDTLLELKMEDGPKRSPSGHHEVTKDHKGARKLAGEMTLKKYKRTGGVMRRTERYGERWRRPTSNKGSFKMAVNKK